MEIATYYVTLKPTSVNGVKGTGMTNIAFVPDPAIEEVGIYLEKHDTRVIANEDIQKAILEYLKTVGCEVPKHWKECTEEDYLQAKEVNLTTDPTSRESFNDVQKKDGGGQWLVRYKYDGPQDVKNREFCGQILSYGRIYTEEEIINGLSNPEFGNYSIFDYKGSYGCRHKWKRLIYFEDYEDDEVRQIRMLVPQVTNKLDDDKATEFNVNLSNDEKMQVCAPLLIPDKDIFRNDELGRYNMRFTKETIEDLRNVALNKKMFERKDLFKDTHEGTTAPSHTIKEWIIKDENDESYTLYNFKTEQLPVGTWMVLSQITDQNFWNKEIKQNKKYAYSIEALMNLTIIKMSKMSEENKLVLPDGEHLLNGVIYVVEGGVVVATKEVTEQQEEVIEEVAVASAEESNAEELSEEVKPEELEVTETPTTDEPDRLSKLEQQHEDLMSEIAKLKAIAETPIDEEVAVSMSDKRPLWKKMSDAIGSMSK